MAGCGVEPEDLRGKLLDEVSFQPGGVHVLLFKAGPAEVHGADAGQHQQRGHPLALQLSGLRGHCAIAAGLRVSGKLTGACRCAGAHLSIL
jgi:hypothetical protein